MSFEDEEQFKDEDQSKIDFTSQQFDVYKLYKESVLKPNSGNIQPVKTFEKVHEYSTVTDPEKIVGGIKYSLYFINKNSDSANLDKGIYLYRKSNLKKVFALVIHDKQNTETLTLNDMNGSKDYIANISWPPCSITDAPIKAGDTDIKLLNFIILNFTSRHATVPLSPMAENEMAKNIEKIIKGTLNYHVEDDPQKLINNFEHLDKDGLETMRNALRNKHKEKLMNLSDGNIEYKITRDLSIAWRPYINEEGLFNKFGHFFLNYIYGSKEHQQYINPKLCLNVNREEKNIDIERNDDEKTKLQQELEKKSEKSFKYIR